MTGKGAYILRALTFLKGFAMLIPRLPKTHNTIDTNAIKNDISSKIDGILTYATDHPELVTAITALIFGSRHILRSLIVSHRVNKENRRKDYTLYDPHTGFHYQLCRKLTNNDYVEISRRQELGKPMHEILWELGAI